MTKRIFSTALKALGLGALCLGLVAGFNIDAAHAAAGAKKSAEQKASKKGKKLSPEVLMKRGMAAAPKAIELAGLRYCEPATAIEMGKTPDKGTAYEIDCKNNDGWIIIVNKDKTSATSVDCVRAKSQGATCKLPGNADAHKMMQPFVDATGQMCDINKANFRGTNPKDGENFVEVACANQQMSFFLGAKPGAYRAIDCITAKAMGIPCEFTDDTQVAGAQMAIYQNVANRAGKEDCTVTKGRIIGVSQETGETIYEFACQNRGSGWLIGAPNDPNATPRIFDCLSAKTVFSTTCEFSDNMALLADYTAFMTANNEQCAVTKAELLGKTGSGLEIREFSCTGKPGYMVIMEDDKETAKRIFKCADATNIGGGCRMPENQS